MLRSISVALRDRNRAKALSSNQSGHTHSETANSGAFVPPLSCPSCPLCYSPRVSKGRAGEHGGHPLLSMGRVSPVRCRIAESGRKQKRHTDISHVRGRSPVPTLRCKVDALFISSSVVSSVLASHSLCDGSSVAWHVYPVQYSTWRWRQNGD